MSCSFLDNDGKGTPVSDDRIDNSNDLVTDKTPEEILKDNYSVAFFGCQMWLQEGSELDLEQEETVSVNWNLVDDFSETRVLGTRGRLGEDLTLGLTLELKSFKIPAVLISDDANGISAVYKPELSFKISFTLLGDSDDGPVVLSQSFQERDLSTNKTFVLLNEKRATEVSGVYLHSYTSCQFTTEEIN